MIELTNMLLINKAVYLLIAIVSIGILFGCSRKAGGPSAEEVLSTYPDGSKKVTALFETNDSGKKKLKSFEYYRSGEIKKKFSHKDNLYFGPWTFWYKKGMKFAEGTFDEKTIDPNTGTGSGKYYWPDGSVMIRIEKGQESEQSVVTALYDQKGNRYDPENEPEALRVKIQSILEQWHNGQL